jgi:SAM-dependent methyltransferase
MKNRGLYRRIKGRLRRSVAPGWTETIYVAGCAVLFGWRALKTTVLKRLGRYKRRTPATVRTSYDTVRSRMSPTDFDRYLFGKGVDPEIILREGNIQWGSRTELRRIEREHVADVVAAACQGITAPVVVEAGSGTGANLFLLKHRHPDLRVIGLELSPVSVELAREAATAFDIDVETREADLSKPLPDLGVPVDVVFSCHALEQMPDVFTTAVDSMLALARAEVIFFEPIGELYGNRLRDRVGRWRLRAVDYLNGLHQYLVANYADITRVERLGIGLTPFNETVEVHVRPQSSRATRS